MNHLLPPILLIDNYDSFTYNLYQMLQAITEHPVRVHRNDAVTFDELLHWQPARIVLSPGPGHPANPADFGVCADVLRRQPELNCPVLGVCLGHQGMAHVHGGQVVQAPTIVHGKTSPIAWTFPHPLFKGMSNPFTAMRYHSLVVDEATLPECFEVIARLETGTDKPPGLIMAMQHRQWPMWGVQFHPESIGTPEGQKLLENFLHWQPA